MPSSRSASTASASSDWSVPRDLNSRSRSSSQVWPDCLRSSCRSGREFWRSGVAAHVGQAGAPSGVGLRPSCCNIVSWSTTCQCSASMPPSTRTMSMPANRNDRPVGGMPRNSATCVPSLIHHARYFSSLAERAQSVLRSSAQRRWHRRLEDELPNIRLAERWFAQRGHIEQALGLAGAFWMFWLRQGGFAEGRGVAASGPGNGYVRARRRAGQGAVGCRVAGLPPGRLRRDRRARPGTGRSVAAHPGGRWTNATG
jgi:hypothetical protein